MRRTLLFVIALPLAAALWFGKGEVVGAALWILGPSAPETPAYAVAAPERAPSARSAPDLSSLLRAASVEAGGDVFRRCAACHRLDPDQPAMGPHLLGVVGRPVASVEGYDYSDALAGRGGDWTPEALSAFLADPKGWAPGTKKTLSPMEDAADRAALIVYLNAMAPEPAPIFAAAPAD